jgi:hypothetical protein
MSDHDDRDVFAQEWARLPADRLAHEIMATPPTLYGAESHCLKTRSVIAARSTTSSKRRSSAVGKRRGNRVDERAGPRVVTGKAFHLRK